MLYYREEKTMQDQDEVSMYFERHPNMKTYVITISSGSEMFLHEVAASLRSMADELDNDPDQFINQDVESALS